MNATPQITRSNWLMIAILGFVWGGTFLATEVALNGITPFWLAASRISFASLVMLAIWGVRGFTLFQDQPQKADIINLAVMGAISTALPFSLLAWGQQYVTSAFAGVSMASSALIVLPLAHFFVPGEKLTTRRAIGFLIGFCGVVVLIGGQVFVSTGTALEAPGRFACVAAAGCYATSSVLMRRLPNVDPIGLATVLLLISACIVVPVAFTVEGRPLMPAPKTLGILAFLGLIPTAAANLLRVLVVRSAGPVFTSLVNYQVPVWSVMLGALVLSEPLPPSLMYAMALILTGVCVSQYGALKRLFTRS